MLQPQDGADQRRGDIKVSKHGVGVVPRDPALTWSQASSRCPAGTTTRGTRRRGRPLTETVPREAMQALVRVQAHMLARIVVEIRAAADIAVELVGTVVYRDVFYAGNF